MAAAAVVGGPWLASLAGGSGHSTTDPVSQGLVAALLVATFVLLALERVHRVLAVAGAVSLLWLITYYTPWRLISFVDAAAAVDLNVLLLLAGMMALVGVLKTTGLFPWMVDRLLRRAGGRPGPIQRIVLWTSGLVSSVADNVTTVIFLTPMATDMARRTRVPPMVFLLPMIMAANIGGTATLIGDPPNILIGSAARLDFMTFVANLAIPVLCLMILLEWVAGVMQPPRAAEDPATPGEQPPARITNPALLRWGLGISALVFVGFATHGLTGMPVSIPALIGAAALLVVQETLHLRTHRPTPHERARGLLDVIEREIEWPTLAFFVFLFILVGAAVATGLMDTLAGALAAAIGRLESGFGLSGPATVALAALIICWVSGILSGLVDNIPFVAVAIPVVDRLSSQLPGAEHTLWWALALGACLGGNATVVGASANVTVVGLAEREGVRIGFGAFSRFGVPVTAMSLGVASVFLAGWAWWGEARVRLLGGGLLLLLFGLRWLLRRRATSTATARSQ